MKNGCLFTAYALISISEAEKLQGFQYWQRTFQFTNAGMTNPHLGREGEARAELNKEKAK